VIQEWWNAKNPAVPKPERDSSSLSVKRNSFSGMKNNKFYKFHIDSSVKEMKNHLVPAFTGMTKGLSKWKKH